MRIFFFFFENELCGFYCLVIHKRLTVEDFMFTCQPVYLIVFHKEMFKAKSYLSRYHNFFTLLSVSAFSFALIFILFFLNFNFHSCRGNVEKMVFIASVSLSQNKSGPHTYFEVGWSLVVFSFIRRITTYGHLLKTIKE